MVKTAKNENANAYGGEDKKKEVSNQWISDDDSFGTLQCDREKCKWNFHCFFFFKCVIHKRRFQNVNLKNCIGKSNELKSYRKMHHFCSTCVCGLTFTAILNVPPARPPGRYCIRSAVDKCNCYFNFMQHRLLKAELMRRRPGEG